MKQIVNLICQRITALKKLSRQKTPLLISPCLWGNVLFLFVFISCNEPATFIHHNSLKNSDTVHKTRFQQFAEPQIIYLHSTNRAKAVEAGKPVTTEDSSHGRTLFFTQIGTEQGLPVNSVLCSTIDRSGNLWFGTAAGVSRYDGKSFTNYTIAQGLSSNVVFAVKEDQEGNIWMATSAGVSKYDGYRFTNFTTAEGLAGNFVSCILEDRNRNLWFGTHEGGISKFDGKKFINFTKKQGLSDNYIQCISSDRNGNIWIGTGGGGVSKYNGLQFTNYLKSDGLANNSVNNILQDKSGNMWFATRDGVSKYNGVKFVTFTTDDGLAENNVSCIEEDKNGDLWFGTQSKGISKFDGKKFAGYSISDDAAENNMTSILEDQSGNLWFTSQGGGVSKFLGNSIVNYTLPKALRGNLVFAIMQDKLGNLWFGTNNAGVSKYDGKRFSNFTSAQGLTDDLIWSIMQDKSENLWFGTDKGGVIKFDGKKFSNYTTTQGLPNNTITCILQDRDENIWFGTFGGASKFDGKSFTNYSISQGLVGNNILNMVEDKEGNIWFATHDNGVCKFDGKRFTNFTINEGLPSNTVYMSIEDKNGNLWFGTNKGASKYDGKQFTNYSTEQGMADDYIWAIAEDRKRDIIWFGTNRGLSALQNDPSSKSKQVHFQNFNVDNGYPIKEVNAGALLIDDNGMLWVGSGHNALIRFDYAAVNRQIRRVLHVAIQNIKVNNENVCWNFLLNQQKKEAVDSLRLLNEMVTTFGKVLAPSVLHTMQKKYAKIEFDSVGKFYPIPFNLVLPYNDNTITIDFAAIEPSMPTQVRYQYKLEGYSKDWSPLSNNSSAVFQNIAAGNYIFKLKALSQFGVWSETQYAFKVLPPWWFSWWAYTLYGLVAFAILYTFYRSRIRMIERKQAAQINIMVATQEEERARIARDLHDDVGIKLSALKLFLSSLHQKASLTGDDEIKTLADRSENLVSEAMRDVRQLLLNLSPGVLEEFGYITAVASVVNKINETGKIHFCLTTFGINQRLQRDYELALYRITQELINNVLKHSQAKNVSLQIGQRDEKIIVMIEDDGKGFEVKNHNYGHGLNNLDIRTKLMKGTMSIDSQPGNGTSVSIEIPYI